MKIAIIFMILFLGCVKEPKINHIEKQENKNNTWIFIMAGQSNMAGRATIEPCDTATSKIIKVIDINNELSIAKEPLHKYEPSIMGLDCGMSFATDLLNRVPDSVSIILVPCAIGGTSISEWNNDQFHSGVQLMSNLTEKVNIAKKYGIVKGLLWHQGENDAISNPINYKENLISVFEKIRLISGNENLPIYAGELGSFLKLSYFKEINSILYRIKDVNLHVIKTSDLTDKGDNLHFDSKSQRELGKRISQQINL